LRTADGGAQFLPTTADKSRANRHVFRGMTLAKLACIEPSVGGLTNNKTVITNK
jgi:hypothetical protein